jgi:Icc protein
MHSPLTATQASDPRQDVLALNTPAPLRLLQLSDLHLFAKPSERLLGITPRVSFEAVLSLARASSPPAHALVLTGDLVHDESPAGYAYLQAILAGVGSPAYCLAGNHDRRDLMGEYLGRAAVEPLGTRRLAEWNLIFLDSVVPGRNHGHLQREQLDHLDDLLADSRAATLIFLHHHPIPVKSAWIDTMSAINGADLIRICARHPQVKAVVFGHVHQAFASTLDGLQILGTPSTCIQFLPGSADFALDDRLPGYRELLLYPDGRLVTRVVRLEQYQESPCHCAAGY